MYSPGYDEGFKENKNAKKITFKKNKGRIQLYMGGKKVGGSRMVSDRLEIMESEIKNAEAGYTVSTMKDLGSEGYEYKRHGVKSTFPSWFGEMGFNSRKDFMKVINRKKGVRYERLVNKAIDDLSDGHDSAYGRVPPDMDFKVKTKQVYDNRNVVFRYINGRVVPIRTSRKRPKQTFSDEVPF